jgi:hypothetical protein
VTSFKTYRLQKKIDFVDNKIWGVKGSLRKFKVMVFKKEEKLKAKERWRMKGEHIAMGQKFNYLRELLENAGGGGKQQTSANEKGY